VKGDENRDSYERLLRYVYVNGVCINEEMIRTGYAEARYIPEVNSEKYIALEIGAEINRLALWKCTVFQPRSVVNGIVIFLSLTGEMLVNIITSMSLSKGLLLTHITQVMYAFSIFTQSGSPIFLWLFLHVI
jgi:hypothetical protein